MSEATKFINIISEALDTMNESSLSRIYAQNKDRPFGTITSDRAVDTEEEKAEKRAKLKSMIHRAGYGIVPLYGRYEETGSDGKPALVRERSFGVIDNSGVGDDKGKMLRHLKAWGTMFDQDTILHKANDTDVAFLHSTNPRSWVDKEPEGKFAVGKFTPNVTNPNGDSSLKGHSFSYLNSNVRGSSDYRPQEKTKLGKVYA